MAFSSVPNFGDPYAKVNERPHPQSGATIVEVLYGAIDRATGLPCSPEKGSGDGHGHWVALEIDGLYQMLMWRHPRSEGGHQEYGISRSDNPLHDLEEDIRKKKSILYEARTLMKERGYDPSKVDSILSSYNIIYSMNTPKERELDEQYRKLKERNDNNKLYYQENARKKYALVSEAQSLSYSTDWKSTSQRMKAMMEEWKSIGYAGMENDRLWEAFNSARQKFFDNQDRHFQEVKSEHEQRKAQKQSLIHEAESAAYSSEWKATNALMDDLMTRWKAVGSAGKDNDDRLWSAFQSARNRYYSRRSAARAEQDNVYATRRQMKSNLVSEAQGHIGDYSPSTADRMKQLSSEWKSIGFCGKDYEDSLWQQFRAAQDNYWAGKKASSRERTEAAIARRREKVSRLYEQNQNLHERINNTRNFEKQNQLYGYISENEGRIRELEMEISQMEQELWR